ncbi:MAG: AraC family transcriptional regulator [Pseudomonadales bacterium]
MNTELSQYHTVGSYALMIAHALEDNGHDAAKCFAAEGVELAQLDDVNFRLSSAQIADLWRMAVRVTGNSAIALQAGTRVSPSSFNTLSMSLWLCSDMISGLQRFLRYNIIFTTSAFGKLSETDKEYVFEINIRELPNGKKAACNESIEAFLAAFLTICRNRSGPKFSPTRVELVRDEGDAGTAYREFFNCPMRFSTEKHRIHLSRESLDAPLTAGNKELFDLTEQAILVGMARLNDDQILTRIRRVVKTMLPGGEGKIEDVASSLNMSPRALQRRLKEIGLSYRELVDDYRRELAIVYIRQPDISQGEISYQLGFSSSSNFSRAFKSWTGVTPGQYREGNLA